MSYNPKSLFNQIKQKEQDAAASTTSAGFANEFLFKPKQGTMTVRLLWLPPLPDKKRDYPMINSYVHKFYDPNAIGKKFAKCVCSTSQYMDGETRQGFDNCPICKEVSKFYKEGQEGSASAKQLYKTFRRTCECYVPVYIVTGPEDMQGQVKILQYGKQFKDFFNRKIFGIAAKTANAEEAEPVNEDEIIGLDAFMYFNEESNKIETVGYDLIITTTTKAMNIDGKSVNMPQYNLDFSRKPKNIEEINGIELNSKEGIALFKNLNNDINFDRDFFMVSSELDRQKFVSEFILKKEMNIDESTENSVADDNIVEQVKPEPVKKVSKKVTLPKKQEPTEPEEEQTESNQSTKSDDFDDIDIDELCKDL